MADSPWCERCGQVHDVKTGGHDTEKDCLTVALRQVSQLTARLEPLERPQPLRPPLKRGINVSLLPAVLRRKL